MSYLKNIGKKAKKAFEDLKRVKHSKIRKVLEDYSKTLLKNKKILLKKILKISKVLKECI